VLQDVSYAIRMRQFLFDVSVLDPSAYVSVCSILVCAATAATFVPTRRAIRIDPVSAFRCE
jgi:ABC-type lipoprotein release transport system permease subunit